MVVECLPLVPSHVSTSRQSLSRWKYYDHVDLTWHSSEPKGLKRSRIANAQGSPTISTAALSLTANSVGVWEEVRQFMLHLTGIAFDLNCSGSLLYYRLFSPYHRALHEDQNSVVLRARATAVLCFVVSVVQVSSVSSPVGWKDVWEVSSVGMVAHQ